MKRIYTTNLVIILHIFSFLYNIQVNWYIFGVEHT